MTRIRTIDTSGISVEPRIELLPTPRLNLHNLEAIRREMTKVYRDMRTNVIDTQDGTRLVYVLGEVRKMFEVIDLERRINQLEEKQ